MENIKVKLIAHPNRDAMKIISFAARTCYQSEEPKWSQKLIDIKKALFVSGHHTTLQHNIFTFFVKRISIGEVTFGPHLNGPFYNTSQRSGRFCAEMFANPDVNAIIQYIISLYPDLSGKILGEIEEYLKFGLAVFQQNIQKATQRAVEFVEDERPNAKQQYKEVNGPKIAQEQMRMFVPVIFPTGLTYSVNLSVLTALWRVAWTPGMREVVRKMVQEVLQIYPKLKFMFSEEDFSKTDWSPSLPNRKDLKICESPSLKLLSVSSDKNMPETNRRDMSPVDCLPFDPRFMGNNVSEVRTLVKMSVATFGQDQRHRAIRRDEPKFTGGFYLPPIPASLSLYQEGEDIMRKWFAIAGRVPGALAMILAPYGAMVQYEKIASFNALLHEQSKRLCLCAQEEIRWLSSLLRQALEEAGRDYLVESLAPGCFFGKGCGEGKRYCGRDLSGDPSQDPNWFSRRRI